MGQIEYTSCAMKKRTESVIFGACKIYPGVVSLVGVVDGGPPARQNCPTESFTPKPPPLFHFTCGNKFTNYNIYRIFNRLCTFLTVNLFLWTYVVCVHGGKQMPYQTVSMVMDSLYIGLFGQGKCILRRQSECIR